MKYFTFFELEYSQTAIANGIKNYPTPEIEDNLRLLVERLLDPLREQYGKPIIVGSGFRCPKVNKLVGGVPTSQHMKGCAADLQTGTKEGNRHLARMLATCGLPFDQLIDEHDYSWIHVSYNPSEYQRRQILRITKQGTKVIKAEEL